jgi:hypothetical protein
MLERIKKIGDNLNKASQDTASRTAMTVDSEHRKGSGTSGRSSTSGWACSLQSPDCTDSCARPRLDRGVLGLGLLGGEFAPMARALDWVELRHGQRPTGQRSSGTMRQVWSER